MLLLNMEGSFEERKRKNDATWEYMELKCCGGIDFGRDKNMMSLLEGVQSALE